MKKRILWVIPALLLLTGCSTESLADRTYAQGIALHGKAPLTVTMQGFDREDCLTASAQDVPSALRLLQAQTGGTVFTGHTELVCTDGSTPPGVLLRLLTQEGVSPSCKIRRGGLPEDAGQAVLSQRMAEQSGMIPVTELSTALDEWLGECGWALLPTDGGSLPGFVLMHRDGRCIRLGDDAAGGMRFLRRRTGAFDMTAGGETVRIRRISLHRELWGDTVRISVRLHLSGASAAARRMLREQVQMQCDAAVAEMLGAGADVIGLQAAYEAAGRRIPEEPDVRVTILP